mgnify:FL=1
MTDLVARTVAAATAWLPPPIPGGPAVTPALADWIRADAPRPELADAIVAGIEARTRFGFDKYGQVLCAADGRPNYAETLQEVFDGLQYAHRAEMDGDRIDDPVMVAALLLLCRKVLRSDDADELDTAARRAYDAYNEAGPAEKRWLTWDGRAVPRWPDLPETIREKWRAAVFAGAGGRR